MFFFKKNKNKRNDFVNITQLILNKQIEPFFIKTKKFFLKRSYYILVYDLYDNGWKDLYYNSKKILGVTQEEFTRVCCEKFNAELKEDDFFDYLIFLNENDAKKAIKEFTPYYYNYYVPKVIIDRLSRYDENGYQPPEYLKSYK